MHTITQNQVIELSFTSLREYSDPFNDVRLDVLFTDNSGREMLVPAFWAGGNLWHVRFASPTTGFYEYRTTCSNADDADLHGVRGRVEVIPYRGNSPLDLHGRITASPDHRHFRHHDGTPFFWLADTWWMGLSSRLDWPDGFRMLAEDRVRKGFTVIQIVMGPYPDMEPFDPRGEGEAGFSWEPGFSSIKPAYYNLADKKIRCLIDMGLIPCIVGCWAYHVHEMGIDNVKKHWRNLVARYGAYPVFWCLAGESAMPFYMSEHKEADSHAQIEAWSEIAGYVREMDPFGNMITIHPTGAGRSEVTDAQLLDFDMLQTGHADRLSLPNTVSMVVDAYELRPLMPFVNSEVCYEGIGEACRQEIQRLVFWSCMLSGAAGHTYGANGLWQFNTPEQPYGASPHGMAWGGPPWKEAYQLAGSGHVGLGKTVLERYDWQRFEPHPEWIEPHWTKDNYIAPYAAGIPGTVRVIYFPYAWWGTGVVKHIEPGKRYKAVLISPIDGSELPLGAVLPDESGDWEIPGGNPPWKVMPVFQDWVLVLAADSV